MPAVNYTTRYLHKLEAVLTESGYVLRYEKGSFKPGYCILKEQGLVLVNAYYPLEGKINCLLEIIKALPFESPGLSEKSRRLITEIKDAGSMPLFEEQGFPAA